MGGPTHFPFPTLSIRFVKIMYFDTPKTWFSYKPMDREKSLLLAITFFLLLFLSISLSFVFSFSSNGTLPMFMSLMMS
ncbi:hypothetical protein MPTK1_5g24380 [Marchantia polymorpha subsp. ruderalis]|uniref:Uncharacterized protein n=2 Tax=Marchantia polymorpha TaxID=3197 RepID=A0AAF6BLT1_MARPO|nr:hypothetical protein MARPO_0010s0018 [Marchantia polymorpha]BBN12965.1 hypothetical protein Mp_5g24380 [Marchantia polymorpha subsp. ruderalis]|eukprot:PTQ46605.1 hypothetical protein MARPO_0010s0018 [Marchantia polymorpha]